MNNQLNLFKILFLISAIINILYAVGWTGNTIFGSIISCGLGCVLGAFPILNIIACVMDFTAYNKLNRMDRTGTRSTIQFAAIFDIISILTGNIASMIFGIIVLANLNRPDVTDELRRRGIY